MKPRINFITLAVDDLARSYKFYKEGLGLPSLGRLEGNEDHLLFELENGLSLVLYKRSKFSSLTPDPDAVGQTGGFMISHFAESKDEVDLILKKAMAAGASKVGVPREEAWGYTGSFADPDGHQWEINWDPDYKPDAVS